jgi:lipopolysaccharide transport system ATP-binding protein
MNDDIAIKVENLSKCYHIYDQPRDRLKQMILPRLQRGVGMPPRQYFREFWALKDVSFEVKKGETVGIIGRNGSGKSTLLQLICGTLNPTSGSIQTTGRIAALLELGSGFNPEFTGRENVYMNGAVLGLSRAEIDSRFDEIAAFADIGDFIEQPVKTYSSGMMVRLAFAVIAHVDADILVIDEALAVGDAIFTQRCMRFLRQFMQKGTVLFVSHDTAAVTNLCQKAILLNRGAVIASGTAKRVVEKYLELNYQEIQNIQLAMSDTEMEINSASQTSRVLEYQDMRAEFINSSNLRNDIEVFKFDENAPTFGEGGVSLVHVHLLNAEGQRLSWVVGGEDVALEIAFRAHKPIEKPIVGFLVKDRLGQVIFADNTYLAMLGRSIKVDAGQCLVARFEFQFPVLPTGEYSISCALANGTQVEHVQLLWVHDAMILNVQSSAVCFGLIGWPMRSINFRLQ